MLFDGKAENLTSGLDVCVDIALGLKRRVAQGVHAVFDMFFEEFLFRASPPENDPTCPSQFEAQTRLNDSMIRLETGNVQDLPTRPTLCDLIADKREIDGRTFLARCSGSVNPSRTGLQL